MGGEIHGLPLGGLRSGPSLVSGSLRAGPWWGGCGGWGRVGSGRCPLEEACPLGLACSRHTQHQGPEPVEGGGWGPLGMPSGEVEGLEEAAGTRAHGDCMMPFEVAGRHALPFIPCHSGAWPLIAFHKGRLECPGQRDTPHPHSQGSRLTLSCSARGRGCQRDVLLQGSACVHKAPAPLGPTTGPSPGSCSPGMGGGGR